jgi:hypothetical protein
MIIRLTSVVNFHLARLKYVERWLTNHYVVCEIVPLSIRQFLNLGAYSIDFGTIFLNGIVGGGVLLAPLGTAATNRPIVPAPGDYNGGEIGGVMIGRGNQSTRRKPAPLPLCPPQTLHAWPDANPGRRGGKPATKRLSYGTASFRK